jgi:predicted nucleic acid-binding protein
MGKVRPHGAVIAWIEGVEPRHLFISAMTVAEIQSGVEITRQQDAARASEIEHWLLRTIATSQVLPMDTGVARIWAKMMQGRSKALAEDAWIAATARHHRLTVVTRNVRDFAGFGADVFNPFEDRRAES